MRVRGERREPREERRAQPPRAKAQGSWLSFFTGLAVGLSVAVLEWFWFQQTPMGVSSNTSTPTAQVAPLPGDLAEAPEPIPGTPAAPRAPTFDFFTVLPDTEVKVSDTEVPVEEEGPAPESQAAAETERVVSEDAPGATPAGPSYMLQVGSFQSGQDAEQSKALLALQGVQASVQKVAINGQAWFRVHVGPFSDLTRAQQTRARLDQLGIRAIVLKVGGSSP